MQISDNQTDETSLSNFGAEAIQLLSSGDGQALADRFGYALAFGREPAVAIREDLAACLAQVHAVSLAPEAKRSAPAVKYLEPNDSGLFALIECLALTNTGAGLLVELVVTTSGQDKHVCLEQISVAA
ncbi:hypothetical protein ACYX7E_18870 [Luteimonas sp. RIT-PG2_3]